MLHLNCLRGVRVKATVSAIMDIQTLLHNLHEEVSCSVCMCKFTDPKLLPCLHTFCLKCLSGIQRTSGSRGTILYPECRRKVRSDLNALPTNFKINRLLDVLAIKECDTSGVKEARNSFFGLGVYLLKSNFRIEDKLRFP